MKKITLLLVLLLLTISLAINAKDYNASLFGIKSNGTTLNTTSIQKAIDYIHDNGGGRLVFYVGRYLTGTIYLKSNVTIQLEEGAILVGSVNPFDYEQNFNWTAMIFALGQQNIGITGKGVIDGQGFLVANNLVDLIHKGVVIDPLKNDRPRETIRPQNIYFRGCRKIRIEGITLKDPGSWNQQYDQCTNLVVDRIMADSKSYWNNDGIDIVDCDSVSVINSYFDAADDGICLKSHSPASIVGMPDALIENVTLKNIEIHYPGGGNASFAKVGLDELDKVPEMADSYPEFSMFKELPAWGFYIRHAKGIIFENVTISCGTKDYRAPVVLDDVHRAEFKELKVTGPGAGKNPVYSFRSTDVVMNRK